MEKVTTYTGYFLYSIFLVSHIGVIQESTVTYEFLIWIQKKIVFKNKCCVSEEQL